MNDHQLRLRRVFLAAIVVAAASLTAQQPAQQAPAGGGLAGRFKQLDRNGDGRVSPEEFPGPHFKQMDKDGDGFVTFEEAQTYFAAWRTARSATQQPARPATTPSAPIKSTDELTAVDAVFELCVRDVEGCVKFYRDGIAMREVEPADASNDRGSRR